MPVAKMLQNVGGTKTLLGLVAMATDVEGLYAAVKALVCVIKSSKQALHDLDRISGHQVYILYTLLFLLQILAGTSCLSNLLVGRLTWPLI